jgi:uncharacterized membrane protein
VRNIIDCRTGTEARKLHRCQRIRARLWQGRDHLLLVYNSGYAEDYKRFYYRDIQAIVTRKTARGMVWNIVLALFAVFFAALAFTTSDREGTIVLGSFAGFFLLLLLTNALRGPTCVTHLQTAVSREDLPSLNRLRVTRKVVGRLRPLIEAAQGALSAEEMRAKAAEAARLPRPEIAAVRASARPLFPYNGGAHAVLFLLLLFDGALSAADIFLNSVALTLAGTLLMMAIGAFIIIALTKQHDSAMGRGVRVVTWSSLAYVCLMVLLTYAFFMSLFITNPELAQTMNDQWATLRMMSALSPVEKPFLMALFVLSIACSVPLGFAGLVLVEGFRRDQRLRERRVMQPATLPAEPSQGGVPEA